MSTAPPQRPRNLKPWAIAAALIVVAGIVAGLVTGGGSGGGDTTTTDSAGNPTTPTAQPTGTLTRAGAIATTSQFADYWTDENLSGLEEVFAGHGFTLTVKGPTCSGAKSPMDLDAALAEFDCDFQKLELPEAKATATSIDLGKATAAGSWSLTDKGKAVSHGTFKMHLVPQGQDKNPILDSLELDEQQ